MPAWRKTAIPVNRSQEIILASDDIGTYNHSSIVSYSGIITSSDIEFSNKLSREAILKLDAAVWYQVIVESYLIDIREYRHGSNGLYKLQYHEYAYLEFWKRRLGLLRSRGRDQRRCLTGYVRRIWGVHLVSLGWRSSASPKAEIRFDKRYLWYCIYSCGAIDHSVIRRLGKYDLESLAVVASCYMIIWVIQVSHWQWWHWRGLKSDRRSQNNWLDAVNGQWQTVVT